jgi:hypothetical protein
MRQCSCTLQKAPYSSRVAPMLQSHTAGLWATIPKGIQQVRLVPQEPHKLTLCWLRSAGFLLCACGRSPLHCA